MQNIILSFVIFTSSLAFAGQENNELSWEWDAGTAKKETLSDPANLKVLWWNMACGNINDQLMRKNKEPDSLYKNINILALQKNPPDIIALGESCPGHIPKATQALLKKVYPYNFNLVHSNPFGKTRMGIWIFSKWKLTKINQQNLAPDVSEEQNKITARTYLLFKVTHNKGDFYFSPVHFYNPWRQYSNFELVFAAVGTDNVNYKQAEEFIKLLENDLDLEKDPVLVIGDFNSAKNFYGVNMATVSLFNRKLFDRGTGETTFPTPSGKALGIGFPDVTIDQTFTSFKQGSTAMLPLKGSDHFPILFSF
jgi:endonuclease/exonuclease/phosphatase family metal-dependent hydrolase